MFIKNLGRGEGWGWEEGGWGNPRLTREIKLIIK